MMVPIINEFLDIFTGFMRDRKHFGFTLNSETEEIYRMFSSFLTSRTSWFTTRATGQGETSFHHVSRKIFEDLFFSYWYRAIQGEGGGGKET